MWTFDGDEWTESGSGSKDNRQPETPRFDEFTPELQVIEILPAVPSHTDWPFPPLQ